MTAGLVWNPQAREDLLRLYLDIGVENVIAAERLYDRLQAKVVVLERFPRLGPRRSDIRPSVRMLVEGPYLVLYETHPDTDEGPIDAVEIVRIVDGRRDLTKPF